MKTKIMTALICLSTLPLLAMAFQQTTTISFASGSTKITPAYQSTLTDVGSTLKKNSNEKVLLIGNTDGSKFKHNPGGNKHLAKQRVNAVKRFLTKQQPGISKQISTQSYADVVTICDSPTQTSLDRRVDIVYCASGQCQATFNDYQAWLQNHCSGLAVKSNQDHFFVGVSTNYDMPSTFDTEASAGTNSGNPGYVYFPSVHTGVTATKLTKLLVNITGGYLWHFGRYNMALDAYVSLSSAQRNKYSASGYFNNPDYLDPVITTVNGQITQQATGYGFELKPGISLTHNLQLAALLGYGWSPYKVEQTTKIMWTSDQSYFSDTQQNDFSGQHLITGLQLQYILAHNLQLNASFQYNTFTKENFQTRQDGADNAVDPDPMEISNNISGLNNSKTFSVGINYLY